MEKRKRIFIPEVEKVWNEDYQCQYYRGVIIDDGDHIVERCANTYVNYNTAFMEAEKKLARSPLYSRQTTNELKVKLETYKKRKEIEEKRNAVVIFDPEEWNQWQYIYDPKDGGHLYRFRYTNQMTETSIYVGNKGKTFFSSLIADKLARKGESDKVFYTNRIQNEYDIENLPGHKDIWKILSIVTVAENKALDSEVTIRYLEFNNLTKDFSKKEKIKIIILKRKWPFYKELMDYIEWFR